MPLLCPRRHDGLWGGHGGICCRLLGDDGILWRSVAPGTLGDRCGNLREAVRRRYIGDGRLFGDFTPDAEQGQRAGAQIGEEVLEHVLVGNASVQIHQRLFAASGDPAPGIVTPLGLRFQNVQHLVAPGHVGG